MCWVRDWIEGHYKIRRLFSCKWIVWTLRQNLRCGWNLMSNLGVWVRAYISGVCTLMKVTFDMKTNVEIIVKLDFYCLQMPSFMFWIWRWFIAYLFLTNIISSRNATLLVSLFVLLGKPMNRWSILHIHCSVEFPQLYNAWKYFKLKCALREAQWAVVEKRDNILFYPNWNLGLQWSIRWALDSHSIHYTFGCDLI